jgi:hypothetical protein
MVSERRQTKCLSIGDEMKLGTKYHSVCRCINYCVEKGAEALLSPLPLQLNISMITLSGIVLDCQMKVPFPSFNNKVFNILKINCSAPQ